MNAPNCPLHSPSSAHAEEPPIDARRAALDEAIEAADSVVARLTKAWSGAESLPDCVAQHTRLLGAREVLAALLAIRDR